MTDRYTDQEIIELYRRGRRDPHILDKLRDLTLLPEDNLLSILHLAGEALDISRTQKRTGRSRKISDQLWREIIALRLQGIGYAEIIAHTGVHRGSLNNWRKQAERLGIPVPEHKITSGIQCIPENKRKEEKVMEPIVKEKTQVGQPVKQVNPLHVALAKTLEALTDLDSIDSFIISYTDRILTVNYSIVLEEKS